MSQLHNLYESTSLMDVFSVSRREMSHSNFLCELLKEDSFHGLGTLPLQLFMDTVLRRAIEQQTKLTDGSGKEVMFPSLKSVILSRNLSCSHVQVETEKPFCDADNNSGRVDILATFQVNPLSREGNYDVEYINLIIENKIYAGEHDDQTLKYYQHFNAFLKNKAGDKVDVKQRVAGPRKLYNLYVYLTPAAPCDIDQLTAPESACKECVQICYQDILDNVIDPLLKEPTLTANGRFMLEGYRKSLGVSFADIEPLTRKHNQPKRKTIIMAVGKKEREDLYMLWTKHKPLFIAAINEKNRVADDDTDVSSKRTLYEYKGQAFNMGRLVEAVINDHLADYSKDELNEKFKDIVGEIVSDKSNNSYFEESGEDKNLQNVHVFKQWTESGQYQFDDFCKIVKELGWYDVRAYQKAIPSPEESLMLVYFYDKHEKLITTMMEVLKRFANQETKDEIEPLLRRVTSHRDRTTYDVTLQSTESPKKKLSWGRLAQTVLQDYASINVCTKKSLTDVFRLKKDVLKQFDSSADAGFKGYFTAEGDLLLLDNICFAVKKGWSSNEIKGFIRAAAEQNYDIIESGITDNQLF